MSKSELWRHLPGSSPLLIDIPHCGTHVPPEIAGALSPAARVLPDTDWHVEKLYAFAPGLGATLLHATHARVVVDLNRDPAGTPLYPGAANTELCPLQTFAGEEIWLPGRAPAASECARRIEAYWRPYHASLAAEIDRIRSAHGHCILLDGHSIRQHLPRFFAGTLPDLNLGTSEGRSCAPSLATLAARTLAAAQGMSHVVDGRFKGGYITRHYGRPGEGVHALQLEMSTACYLDEAAPGRWDAVRASPLIAVLERLVRGLIEWRPG